MDTPLKFNILIAFCIGLCWSLSGQNSIEDFVNAAPLDEAYLERIDEWGWSQYYLQQWDSTQTVFKTSLARSEKGLKYGTIQHRINLLSRIRYGAAIAKQGYFFNGIEMLGAALAEGELHFGSILDWGYYYVLQAILYEDVGNWNKAYWGHQQASRIVDELVKPGDPKYFLHGNKDYNLGMFNLLSQRYPEAKAHFIRAIAKFKLAGEDGKLRVPHVMGEYAVTLAHLGDYHRADSMIIALAGVEPQYRADWSRFYAEGRVKDIQGDFTAALAAFRKSVAYGASYVQPTHPFPMYRTLRFIEIRQGVAEFLLRNNLTDEAHRVLDEAMSIAERFGQSEQEDNNKTLLIKAEAYKQDESYQLALELTEQVIGTGTDMPSYRVSDTLSISPNNNSPFVAAALNIQATCLYSLKKQGDTTISSDLIIKQCLTGQRILNEILNSHSAEFQYSELLEKNRQLFDLPINIAYERLEASAGSKQKNDLFQAMEMAKNMDASNRIRLGHTAENLGPELTKLIGHQLVLSAQMRSLEKELASITVNEMKDAEQLELRTSFLQTKNQLLRLSSQVTADYPDYADQINRHKESTSLDELKRILHPDELVLMYNVGDKWITVLGVSRNELFTRQLPAKSLLAKVDLFINQTCSTPTLKRKPDAEWQGLASDIFTKLIGELVQQKELRSIIVVPDGKLNYLPWPALVTELKKGEISWRNLNYLATAYAISSEASATSLFLLRRLQEKNKRQLYLGMAPSYNNGSSYSNGNARGQALEASLPAYFRQLQIPLKYNAVEIDTVSKMMEANQVFLNLTATEHQFKTWAPHASFIHLAAHGVVNPEYPSYSNIALLPDEAAGEDGLVYSDEIYNLPLRADLAVLSACGSGNGKYHGGSGVQSLARAFRVAGCKEVLMSLWPIEDQTAYRMVTHFFEQLKEDKHTAESLRLSMVNHLKTEKNPERVHPYYWTSFSLAGSGRQLPKYYQGMNYPWMLVLAISVGVTILLLFTWKRIG